MRASRTLTTFLATALAALALGACADAGSKATPDGLGTTSADSTISNYYTTIVGELPLDEAVADTIDYPEYYLGRTLELRAGQAIELKLASTRKSLVHVYGPAYGFAGEQPLFGDALVRTTTTAAGGTQRSTVAFTAPAAGTYMVVYGPTNVWQASYALRATCTANCEPVAAEGEECGGFRPPGTPVATCAEGLACVGPYGIIPDLPGRCGVETTVAALLADPAAFDGRYVAVNGVVALGVPMCTKIACPVSNPCCNTCYTEERLFDTDAQPATLPGVTLTEAGTTLSCQGDSCALRETCSVGEGGLWVSGWFHADPTPVIDLERRFATP